MSIRHSESGVVTTIKGKDENLSITYNNVKNIEYVGTQAQNTKFIYNNVDNITKKAVELNNSYSSNSKSKGISAGVTINYNNGFQAEADAIRVSGSKSKMNTDGTGFQNGLFVNVDEVHNNTKNMTLSGFNQVGGKVTGNIQNLAIESKQNTSNTSGSSKSGSIGFAPNGMPSLSANYSQTNGERKYVDDPTTFIIGEGSNLKVGKVDNTAGAIGATGNAKLSIDEYIGHNLENNDETTTKGGSLSLSPNSNVISGVGINYANKDLESVTKNTVIGNVEIGKSSGDEINKDLSTMTEVTKDEDTKTNVFVESQTIKYALNPETFKEDIQKAKNEIHDIYHAVDSTVNPQGKESRNVLQQLAETRQAKTILNVVGSRLEIAENQDDIAKAFEGVSEDLGYKVKVIYTDPSKAPQLIGVDKNGNTYIKNGTAYVDKKTGIGYILINTESPANRTKAGVIGTIAEEQSHIIGKIEGRQKVVPDGSEKGLESLGRPTNNYFKNQFSKNDKAIGLKSDGKDYSNVDFGENVGDNPFLMILGAAFVVGAAKVDDYYETTVAGIETGIKNLKDKEKKSEYIKIFKIKGKKAMLNAMAREFDGAGSGISDFSKKLFVIYGATDEIRNLYIHKEKNKDKKEIDMFILDEYTPEYLKDLWSAPETSQNLNKISRYLGRELANKDYFSISKENREKEQTKANPNFTGNHEFFAFGKTTLYQSVYGSVKRLENGKYDVDITVMFQYTDRFEDVKNINNSSVAKQGLNKEFEGGKSFSFKTEPKIIIVKKQVNNLDEITGLLKNRLRNIDDNSEEGKDNIRADFYDSVVF